MSRKLVFAIPGDLQTPSGGYAYDRRLIAELTKLGWTVEHLALAGDYPFPDAAQLSDAGRLLSQVTDGANVLIDGLALGTMPDLAESLAARAHVVALIHHPLGYETGLDAQARQSLIETERRAIAACRAVVVTSQATAETLVSDFGVPRDKIAVALPGTDRAARAEGHGDTPLILAIGTQSPRKDHATLVAALSQIRDRAWTAHIVGSDTADPGTATRLKAQIGDLGLGDRTRLTGAMADVAPLYGTADIFALASRYEGYGMVFAEAMVRGLPIVACRAGAVPDVTGEEAAILCAPGDVAGFAAALGTLLDDRELRRRMGDASFARGQNLPGWDDTAGIVAAHIESTTQIEGFKP